MTLPWKHPFTCICAGPSGCGKTTFVTKFLENLQHLIDHDIDEIVWCCSPGSEPNITSSRVRFQHKIPSVEDSNGNPSIFVIDDLMSQGAYGSEVSSLFSKGSHHFNISVFLITQNIFYQSAQSRNISLNAKYIVVFKNPRDRLQFGYLARQVYPENSQELERVYKEVTSKPFGYLVLDHTQDTSDCVRFRTNIFPDEITTVYTPAHMIGNETVEV